MSSSGVAVARQKFEYVGETPESSTTTSVVWVPSAGLCSFTVVILQVAPRPKGEERLGLQIGHRPGPRQGAASNPAGNDPRVRTAPIRSQRTVTVNLEHT